MTHNTTKNKDSSIKINNLNRNSNGLNVNPPFILLIDKPFNLNESDLEKLRSSFITREMAEAAKLRRTANEIGRKIVAQQSHTGKDFSGIAYPYFNPVKGLLQIRLRLDNPHKTTKESGKEGEAKYLSAKGMGNNLYFPPKDGHDLLEDLEDTNLPIVITEGEKKTLALARLASKDFKKNRWDFLPIGLSGVWNFKTKKSNDSEEKIFLPDFKLIKFEGRKVHILFDANVKKNPHVAKARKALAQELKELGAEIYFPELQEQENVNGIDDLLGIIEREKGVEKAIEEGSGIIRSAKAAPDPKKQNQATRLLNFTADFELFHTGDDECFATIEASAGHYENHLLHTNSFRNWLAYQFFKSEGQMPSSQAIQDALQMLKGKAQFEGEKVELHIRLAESKGKIYLDLCNDRWQIVEISKQGWKVIESKDAPVKFRRTKAMMSLPFPLGNGDATKLKDFLNVDDGIFILILSWLVNCFRPGFPFPMIIITGEQGSAKSTASRILRRLVDPNKADFRPAPRDEGDLVIAATNAWVCAFDNLSSVPPWLSDALCRISTGTGFGKRKLYSDDEETIFSVKRPILLNGIGTIADKGDLLDRAVLAPLKPISAANRQTEEEFWGDFQKVENQIFCGLLTAVSTGLKNIETVKLDAKPRMADFVKFASAFQDYLNSSQEKFLAAFGENAKRLTDTALEGSPLAETIQKFAEKKKTFEGSFQEFLKNLEEFASETVRNSKDYPKTAKGISAKLPRIMPSLRTIGINIEISDRTAEGRKLSLTYSQSENAYKEPSQPSQPSNTLGLNGLADDDCNDGCEIESSTVIQPSFNRQIGNLLSNNSLAVAGDGCDGCDGSKQTFSNTIEEIDTVI